MWKRSMNRLFDRPDASRRKGARLGLLIALMAVVPGLVAGTAYTSSILSGSGNTSPSNQPVQTCGFFKTQQDSQVVTSPVLGAAPTGSTVSVTLNALETGPGPGGTGGYQYESDEFALGCSNLPAGTTTTIVVAICGISEAAAITYPTSGSCGAGTTTESVVNNNWVAMEVGTAAPIYLCNPVIPASSCNSGSTPTATSCGTNNGATSGGSADTLYTEEFAGGKQLVFADNPTGVPSSASNSWPEGVLTGTCVLPATSTTIGAAGTGGGADTITLATYGSTGTCASGSQKCGEYLTITDACAAGATNCATTTPDTYLWFSFNLADEGSQGLQTCTTTACNVGATGAALSATSAFEVSWEA